MSKVSSFIFILLTTIVIFMLCLNFIRLTLGNDTLSTLSLLNTITELSVSFEEFNLLFDVFIPFDEFSTLNWSFTSFPAFFESLGQAFSLVLDSLEAGGKLLVFALQLIPKTFAVLFGFGS